MFGNAALAIVSTLKQSPSLCKGHKIQVQEEEEQVCADISLCVVPRSFHEKRKSKNISNIASRLVYPSLVSILAERTCHQGKRENE